MNASVQTFQFEGLKLTGRRYIDGRGYVRLGCSNPIKWVYEHRFVMAQILDRPLRSDETVHHKNHDRGDNRPENLELMAVGSHVALHNKLHPKRRRRPIVYKRAIPRTSPTSTNAKTV